MCCLWGSLLLGLLVGPFLLRLSGLPLCLLPGCVRAPFGLHLRAFGRRVMLRLVLALARFLALLHRACVPVCRACGFLLGGFACCCARVALRPWSRPSNRHAGPPTVVLVAVGWGPAVTWGILEAKTIHRLRRPALGDGLLGTQSRGGRRSTIHPAEASAPSVRG